jgi:hypothetical protein
MIIKMRREHLFRSTLLSIALAAMCTPLWAQDAPPAQNPPPAPVPPSAPAENAPAPVVLKEGTEVSLAFAQDLSSKTAVDDDRVSMTLDDDLKVGDVVVVKKGAPAVATITNAKKAGMIGKAGELSIRLEYLKADESRIRLRGSKGKEGEGKAGTAVALTVLFGPIGLIKHGKNVEIKQGTLLTAYVDQDTPLPPAK